MSTLRIFVSILFLTFVIGCQGPQVQMTLTLPEKNSQDVEGVIYRFVPARDTWLKIDSTRTLLKKGSTNSFYLSGGQWCLLPSETFGLPAGAFRRGNTNPIVRMIEYSRAASDGIYNYSTRERLVNGRWELEP